MKKYLAILLTVLMLFSSVSALAEYEGYFKTNVGLVNLPLTDQEETLSYAGYDSWLSNYSYKDDQPIWKLFEEQTGVKIDFQVYSSGELESALSVRLTSGMNLPDITQLPPSWTNTGVMKYVDEGVIIDLTDLIDQYAPNIKALMEEDPYLAAQMIAPDGRIYSVIMIAPPVDENGHTAISKRFPTGMYYGISADCKNPELAIKWIDYIGFSAEANIIKDYGIEGKTFVYDENGEPQFTDYIMNNPDGYSPHDAMRTVGGAPSVLVFDTPENYLKKFAGSAVYDCIIALQPYMVDANPLILPSQEESAAYSEVWPDIQVYYKEMFARFISGSESLDNFDGFVETMNDIGLDKVLEIKSNQMHRYKEYMNSIG